MWYDPCRYLLQDLSISRAFLSSGQVSFRYAGHPHQLEPYSEKLAGDAIDFQRGYYTNTKGFYLLHRGKQKSALDQNLSFFLK